MTNPRTHHEYNGNTLYLPFKYNDITRQSEVINGDDVDNIGDKLTEEDYNELSSVYDKPRLDEMPRGFIKEAIKYNCNGNDSTIKS